MRDKIIKRAITDNLKLSISLIISSLIVLIIGLALNKHHPTISSWLVNISASLLIVAITNGVIDQIKTHKLSRELVPSRLQAITDLEMELGSAAMQVYGLIDKIYTDSVFPQKQITDNEKGIADKFYRTVFEILNKLNTDKSKEFIEKSNISERHYVDLLNRIDNLQNSIESIRRKYAYALNSHLNDELLELTRIKPASGLYDLHILLLPSQSTPINKKGVDTLKELITSLIKAWETTIRLEGEISSNQVP